MDAQCREIQQWKRSSSDACAGSLCVRTIFIRATDHWKLLYVNICVFCGKITTPPPSQVILGPSITKVLLCLLRVGWTKVQIFKVFPPVKNISEPARNVHSSFRRQLVSRQGKQYFFSLARAASSPLPDCHRGTQPHYTHSGKKYWEREDERQRKRGTRNGFAVIMAGSVIFDCHLSLYCREHCNKSSFRTSAAYQRVTFLCIASCSAVSCSIMLHNNNKCVWVLNLRWESLGQ